MLPSRPSDSQSFTTEERTRFLETYVYQPTAACEHNFAEIRDTFEKTSPNRGGYTTKNGKFVLGKGNFGKVCLGVQIAPARVVAIKTEYRQRRSFDSTEKEVEFLQRIASLAAERRKANKRAPQVIEMYDVARTTYMSKKSRPKHKRHIIMECGGPSLAACLQTPDSYFSEETIASIVRDVGNGVNDLLAVNVGPPEDLGLTNIIQTERGATIIDLGLAKDLESMSPEVVDEARKQAFRKVVRLAKYLLQQLSTRGEEPISDAATALNAHGSGSDREAIDRFLEAHALALD